VSAVGTIPLDQAPSIGDNSRRFDIERTAEDLQRELRLKFIRANVGYNLPHASLTNKWNTMCYAYVSGMKAGWFMELFGHLAHANGDGSSSFSSHETRAALRGCGDATCERDTAGLEKLGFLPKDDKTRRKHDSVIRCVRVPQVILDAFPLEDQEPSNPRVQDSRTLKSEGSKAKFENQEPSNLSPRTLKSEGLPLVFTQVVEEEVNTLRARELGCKSSDSQPREGKEEARQGELVAKAQDRFTAEPFLDIGLADDEAPLPTKAHLQEFAAVAHAFNYPPDAELPERNHANLQRVKTALADSVTAALKKAERAFVLEALNYALSYTGLKEYDPEHKRGPQQALSYFNKAFTGKLDEIRKREHNARVDAKKVETIAEIDVKDREVAKAKGQAALDRRIELGDQAAQKRIEANGTGKVNGQHHTPPQPERFNDDDKRAETVEGEWITNRHANRILDGIEGATVGFVRNLLLDAARNNWKKKPSPAEVIDWCISRGRTLKLYEVHGTPDKLAGGPAAKCSSGEFRRILHVSQAFVDRMQSAYPSIDLSEMFGIFEDFDFDFEAIGYGAEQQAAFEGAFEGELRQKHERNLAAEGRRAEEEELGVSIDGGRVTVRGWLAKEVERRGGDTAFRVIDLANKNSRFSGLSVERVVKVVRKIADLAGAGKSTGVCLEAGFIA
jgi:hypothetical protein